MEKLKIQGGFTLSGSVRVSGAKNSAVALIPATILAESPVTIEGLPDISDVQLLGDLVEEIGGKVTIDNGRINSRSIRNGCNAFTERKSKKITRFLLFNGGNVGTL